MGELIDAICTFQIVKHVHVPLAMVKQGKDSHEVEQSRAVNEPEALNMVHEYLENVELC